MKRLFNALISATGRFNTSILPKGFKYDDDGTHGFYYVDESVQQNIPEALRMDRYEQDSDWAIPVFFNRHLFTRQMQEIAIATLANYYWKAFEEQTGFTLLPSESPLKVRHLDRHSHMGTEYVNGAFSDRYFDVPNGQVYVETKVASPANSQGYSIDDPAGKGYLIPADMYNSLVLPNEGYKWIDEKFTPYERNKAYETWKGYNEATGQPRYK